MKRNTIKPKILGIILARGGSKSIPKKSIAICAGKPLLTYTIESAKNSKLLDKVILTTDDEEIAEVGRKYGVEVPFMRPSHLGQDTTPDIPVILHAIDELKKQGYEADIVVQLRPTTPLRSGADIDRGVRMLLESDADSVRSVCEPLHTPFKMHRINDQGQLVPLLKNEFPETFLKYPETFNISRQVLPKVWRHSGYLDIMRVSSLDDSDRSKKRVHLPLIIDQWRDVDIDSLHELMFAESIINNFIDQGKNIHE